MLEKISHLLKNITTSECVLIMPHTGIRVNLHSVVTWVLRSILLETGAISEVQVTVTGFEPTTT